LLADWRSASPHGEGERTKVRGLELLLLVALHRPSPSPSPGRGDPHYARRTFNGSEHPNTNTTSSTAYVGVLCQGRCLILVRQRMDSPWRTWGIAPGIGIADRTTPKAFGGVSLPGGFSIPNRSESRFQRQMHFGTRPCSNWMARTRVASPFALSLWERRTRQRQ
jgi:hypothetical protein